jgi:thiamine-phosphate pyrophosphorylase
MIIPQATNDWHLYVITDEQLGRGRSHVEIAQEAIAGGADVIQLRDKIASSNKLYQVALEIRRITREAGVIFIVNDRLDITLAVDADGLHVGQDDLPVSIVRKSVQRNKIVGVSATSLDQAIQAEQDGADYLGVGPIYEARSTKADAGQPLGLPLIQRIRQHCTKPIIAIGGINHNNVSEVIKSGANGVAVISAIVSAPDIAKATRELKNTILIAEK